MTQNSRRAFLTAASGSAALIALQSSGQSTASATRRGGAYGGLNEEILELFQTVPGTNALKIWAPAIKPERELLVEFNASERLVVGSAVKAFILCERLRQLDSPSIVQTLVLNQLTLDASVWSLSSPILNPPNLSGLVSERTAMEAMMMHSDNTGTDMVLA